MLEWKTNYTNPYKCSHTPTTLGNESYLDALCRERVVRPLYQRTSASYRYLHR